MPIELTYDELEKIKFKSEQAAPKLRNAEFLFSQMFEQSTTCMINKNQRIAVLKKTQ